jgi:hypothetical protein
MPVRAALDMPSQHRRAARQDGPRGPPHIVRPPVALREGHIACLKDLLNGQLGHHTSLSLALPPPLMRVRPTKSSAAAGEAGRRLQRIVIPLSLQVITLKFHFGRSFDYPDSRSRYMKR